MASRRTGRKARRGGARRGGKRRYGAKAQSKVQRAMHERKRGTLRSGRSGNTSKVSFGRRLETAAEERSARRYLYRSPRSSLRAAWPTKFSLR